MKKLILAISLILLQPGLNAEETVRLVTDKSVYLAGELVWCSAVCENESGNKGPSSTAYIELVSSSGIAATAKIALVSGIGSGVLELPPDIPTGNYKIFAFTSVSDRAEIQDITVFNTISGARVKGGVVICNDPLPEPVPLMVLPEGIELSMSVHGDRTHFSLHNARNAAVTVSCSIVEDDGLRSCQSAQTQYVSLVPGEPEEDGEIIRASIYGKDAGKVQSMPWLIPVISSPGSAADTYTGKITEDGIISFRTNNIYGKRDLVCELFGSAYEALDCFFSPQSPFVNPKGLVFNELRLSPSMKDALDARNASLASTARADTLYSFLPKRDNLLLSNSDRYSYHLDDYTRFNLVEDIIRELIPYARIKHNGKNRSIRLYSYAEDALVMLDGVPVSNHQRILAFDALALGDVYVYPQKYVMGNTVFSGIFNFVTTRHDMSSLVFDDNVRILDFQGCSYPLALNSSALPSMAPSGRTLFWHPRLEIGADESLTFTMPSTLAPMIVKVTMMK